MKFSSKSIFCEPMFWLSLFFLVGTALRIGAFVNLLPGINQDEASTGYEAFSLFHSGFDRWGKDFLPVYLVAWGSGQNALPSYLISPIVGIFGISIFTIRILPFILNTSLLAIFALYLHRVYAKSGVGFIILGLAIFALSPWHIMVSAWNLESNLAPFFLAVSTLLFESAFLRSGQLKERGDAHPSRLKLCLSGLTLGLTLYCYLATLPVVLFMVAVMALRTNGEGALRKIYRFKIESLFFAGSFALTSWPILFFVLKNHVFKAETVLDRLLPFSVPLLPISRLTQLQGDFLDNLAHNWKFVMSGFQDGLGWNDLPGQSPIQIGLFICALFGFAVHGFRFFRSVFQGYFRPTALGIQLLGSLFLFLLIPLNINRVNALWIPLIAYAALGIREIYCLNFSRLQFSIKRLPAKALNMCILLPIIASVTFESFRFLRSYYFKENDPFIHFHLRFYLKDAIIEAENLKAKSGIPVSYYSDQILWAYLYQAIHLQIQPDDLRRGLVSLTGPHKVEAVGDSYFQIDYMRSKYSGDFVFVVYSGDKLPCKHIDDASTIRGWQVGICRV